MFSSDRVMKLRSVSYTHLDVYKRQDGECGEGSIWEGAMFAHQYQLGNLVVFADRNGFSFDAVSYTHLDVYKRQPPSRRYR